jgi:hypothetical protein
MFPHLLQNFEAGELSVLHLAQFLDLLMMGVCSAGMATPFIIAWALSKSVVFQSFLHDIARDQPLIQQYQNSDC